MVTAHQKANGNGHKLEPYNYTAFLAKDRDVGKARADRPDILFQIRTPELRSVNPDRYVKYNGRMILDPFDHGLQGSMLSGRAVEDLATHKKDARADRWKLRNIFAKIKTSMKASFTYSTLQTRP